MGFLEDNTTESQKEGQEDQGRVKELLVGATLLADLRLPGPAGLPSGSSAGSLPIHHNALGLIVSFLTTR